MDISKSIFSTLAEKKYKKEIHVSTIKRLNDVYVSTEFPEVKSKSCLQRVRDKVSLAAVWIFSAFFFIIIINK